MAAMRSRWVLRVIEEMRAEQRASAEDLRRWEQELRRWDEAARKRAADHARDLRTLRADHQRRFDKIDTAFENDKRTTREILLELQEGREHDRDQRDEMRAQREGLLRILDELRRDDGPSPAGA
jgi:septal ring factor EnvC (AmiA/AmiB activator)